MNELLVAALRYAKKGWPVFPCRADKAPYTDRGVLEASTNPKKIEQWWTTYPRANIGFDVGGAGMVALDLDPGSSYEDLEELLGGLETPLVQRTPRGGEHLFFSIAAGEVVPPSQSAVAKNVDVRSYHSYVLLAPSRTADGEYEWESEGKPAYRPDKLIEITEKAFRVKSKDRDEWLIEADLEENVASAVEYLSQDAQVAVEGLNGDGMAYRTGAMMKSYGISEETAFDLMWQYWNPRCLPPWSADNVEHLEAKIRNAYEYNTSPPGNLTQAYKIAKQQALFKPVSRDTNEGGREVGAGRFRIVDERGVDSIEPPEWLIKDLLPQGGLSLLIGPSGVYKSFIALDIAMSIATGGKAWFGDQDPWLGMWGDVVTKGPVLFVAGEGRAGFKARVQAWKDLHIDGEYTENFYLADPVPYPEEQDLTAFIQSALALNDYYELVVIDTVGRSLQGLNENTQQDASQFIRMTQTIQAELDCAVLALHHTGHDNQGRARGSSVFGTDADTVLVAEKYEDHMVRLTMPKQKDAPEWEQGKLIKLRKHGDSLVAVKPSSKEVDAAKHDAEDTVPAFRGRKGSSVGAGKRKSRSDFHIEVGLVRKAAYQAMKSFPHKEWSKNALANAIAADESISVASGTIRNAYLPELLTDKTHPVVGCYDIGKECWVYRPPKAKKKEER